MENQKLVINLVKNNSFYAISKPNSNSSLSMWLNYTNNQHDKIVDMGLSRIEAVAHKLDLLHPAPKIITVAGTNGKGTTCNVLELILIEAGLKVGVYTSPYLLNYTENIRIQNKMLSEKEICQVFAKIEYNRGAVTLTNFEYNTLIALQLFKQAKLDVVILEVGLGGRLDATNIIDANLAVITNIALDHTDWLGNSREQIGYEKSGIFRSGCFAIIGETDIPKSISDTAKIIGTKLFCCGIDWKFSLENNYWNWQSNEYSFRHLPLLNIPLANAATALAVVECLIKDGCFINKDIMTLQRYICNGLVKAKLPGRFQIISKQPYIILDVAHNPHASSYLANKLSCLPRQEDTKVYAIIAMLVDKDIKNTLFNLAAQIDQWYFASLSMTRGASADQLAEYVNSSHQFNTVKDAWLQLMKVVNKNDIVIVCGSFHTVAEVIKLQFKNCKHFITNSINNQ